MHIFPSYYNVYEFSIMNRCNRLQSYMSKNIQCKRINIFKQKTSSHFSEKFSANCDTWSSKKLQSFEKTFLQQKNHNDTRTCWLWQISKHLKLMCFYKSFHLTKKAPKVKKSVIKTCDQRNKLNNTGEPTVISWSPSAYVHLTYCVVTKPSQTFGITCFKLMYLIMTFSKMGTHLFHRLLLKE